MKRQLFFFIERLEINRSERISILALLACLLVTSSLHILEEPKVYEDPGHYARLEKIFLERSRAIEKERGAILARYEPIVMPDFSEETADTISPDSTKREKNESNTQKININQASVDQLMKLPGIGPTYARRIVAWRNENGEFQSTDQLLEIRGIGKIRLENMKPLIEL